MQNIRHIYAQASANSNNFELRQNIMMYRVSGELNERNEPSGSYLYFVSLNNAVKALKDFKTSLTVLPYCPQIAMSDDCYRRLH